MSYSNPSAKYPGIVAYPMLDTNSDPIAWRAAMVTELKTFAPLVASDIETGINEIAALIDPTFEDVYKRGRRVATNNPVIFATLTIAEQVLPVFHDPPPAAEFINWSDDRFYYCIRRRTEFIGDGGKCKFDSILRHHQQLRTAFKKEKSSAFAHLTTRIAPTIHSKIEIPHDEFNAMRIANDYMTLLNKAEVAVSGGGVRAVGQWLIKLTQISMKSHDQRMWTLYKLI